LMAEQVERAFVIGWGTGVTTGELAALDASRSIQVAEISRAVIAAAPFFDVGNGEASKSPKVEIIRGDAYRSLLRSDGEYNLIVSEPSNPWVTGVEMLYSREFLQAARERLAPGGVYAQWFHVYESDVDVVSLVLRTYAEVFPHVSVWFALGPDLLLLGFDEPQRPLDVAALEKRFAQPDFRAGFSRVGIETFPAVLAHELLPLGTLHAAPLEGEIQTLRHPILSYRAARAFFLGKQSWMPPFATPAHRETSLRNSLLLRYAESTDVLPERVLDEAAREMCRLGRTQQCATLFARWQLDRPGSPRLKAALAAARKDNRKAGREIGQRQLRALQMLFNGRIPDVPEPAQAQQAERLTERFLRYYHHPVPFDRRVIDAAWRRCSGGDCEERQRKAWASDPSPEEHTPALSESAVPKEPTPGEPDWDAPEGVDDLGTQEIE
jgi:hypothetical protein